jgi:hypothetical protein
MAGAESCWQGSSGAGDVRIRALIRSHADLESIIHTDGWSSYDGLVDMGYAKHRLTKFHGVNRRTFSSHLKKQNSALTTATQPPTSSQNRDLGHPALVQNQAVRNLEQNRSKRAFVESLQCVIFLRGKTH